MKKIYPRTRILAGVGVAVIFAYIALAAYVAALVLVEHLLRRPLGWQVASGILVVVLLVQSVFAGIINAPIISITPNVGDDILIECFVVIVIGGVGSFPGAVVGGIIAGEIMSLTSMFNPQLSQVMLFAVMTVVLIARPQGLFGTR